MSSLPRLLSTALTACALAGCLDATTPSLDEIRAATGKYRSVDAALADGYVRDPFDTCETPYHLGIFENLGAMGVHFWRPDLLGVGEDRTRLDAAGTHTDFLSPAILVYEPQPDSVLELVAVANVVSARAWDAAGHRDPPSFGSVPFSYRPDDPGTGYAAHYDLHVWAFRDNPSGMFAPYNPAVTCAHHEFNMPMIMPPDMPPDMTHH